MKKIALLLAALLVLGMLAGCNSEEEKTPAAVVSGYDINIYDEGWKAVEDTTYDMQLVKDGVTMSVIGFTVMDFVDVPPASDIYTDANEDMLEDKSEVVTTEPETAYEKNGHKITSTLFSAKDGETNMQYYCFMVEFDDEAGSMAWICFGATTEVMQQRKSELKKLVESMDANGKYVSPEEQEAEIEAAMGEDGVEGEDEITEDELYGGEDITTMPTEHLIDATEPSLPENETTETEPEKEKAEPAEGEDTEEETKPAEGETATEEQTADASEETVTGETTPAEETTEATE